MNFPHKDTFILFNIFVIIAFFYVISRNSVLFITEFSTLNLALKNVNFNFFDYFPHSLTILTHRNGKV